MASMLCASLCGKTFPRVSIASVYGEQLIWVNFANRLARKRLLHRLNLRSGVLPLFFVWLAIRRLFPYRKIKNA